MKEAKNAHGQETCAFGRAVRMRQKDGQRKTEMRSKNAEKSALKIFCGIAYSCKQSYAIFLLKLEGLELHMQYEDREEEGYPMLKRPSDRTENKPKAKRVGDDRAAMRRPSCAL